MKKTLLLLIGPESTGTRLFTEILSQHPFILGTSDASQHYDSLDAVWKELESRSFRRISRAIQVFPCSESRYILTRRSMPHSLEVGQPAKFMKFVNLNRFYRLCQAMQLDLILLITVRSPLAHISSWSLNRASTQQSVQNAIVQYHAAYIHIFKFIERYNIPFILLSLEGLLLDEQKYVQSIFQLLRLPSHLIDINLERDVNSKHYIKAQENSSKYSLIKN